MIIFCKFGLCCHGAGMISVMSPSREKPSWITMICEKNVISEWFQSLRQLATTTKFQVATRVLTASDQFDS